MEYSFTEAHYYFSYTEVGVTERKSRNLYTTREIGVLKRCTIEETE